MFNVNASKASPNIEAATPTLRGHTGFGEMPDQIELLQRDVANDTQPCMGTPDSKAHMLNKSH